MPGSFNVTFTAGENSTKFSVSIVNDMMLENDEKFRLVIDNSSLPDGVTIGNHGTTVVTILNDDGKCIALLHVKPNHKNFYRKRALSIFDEN